MTIQQCKYILKIIECGSLNEAARQLFVAQSGLSVSVKSLEQELKIRIFERAGTGVYLTEEGTEFARYARQLVEQNNFILNRYADDSACARLYVSTQHYDFVADIFTKLINNATDDRYRFSLRELRTYEVIHETETACCDVGIIAIKGSDFSIMERYLSKNGLNFTTMLKVKPHVYLRKTHPLANCSLITAQMLESYPYVSYEQGEHNNSFFAEEITVTDSPRQVEVSDRASLMNVLLSTDGYVLGTGIMPSTLNMGRIISIPFDSTDHYLLGYILRSDRKTSELTQTFLQMLHTALPNFQEP